jgi:hypothetical protein
MANVLTNLIPSVYRALDVVSRELVGFVPSVTIDAQAARAALNQTITIPIAPPAAAADVTPAQLPPDSGDQTIGNTTITITKSRMVPFRWAGEEVQGINTGPGYEALRTGQIAQAARTLCNEIEADLAALYVRSSRAYGTAGQAPFLQAGVYNLGDAAQIRKVLVDNGAPETDLQLVIDTNAGVNMRQIPNLTRANEAAGDTLLRQGILLDIFGMAIRESAQVKAHTKGTGAGYLVNNAAGEVVGETSIAVDTGTGTIIPGDVVTFAADAVNKYVVGSALAAGSFSINAPGIRNQTIPDNNAVTLGNNYRANMAFHRSAMVLVTRPPALPNGMDSAIDRQLITDPRSGLTFELSAYAEYKRMHFELAIAWGVANIKTEHTAILLG